MGTFNDPNQFAFFLFTMFLVLFMAYRQRNENGAGETRQQILMRVLFYLVSGLSLFLIVRSMNITVQMYPCSEGTDTGSPAL